MLMSHEERMSTLSYLEVVEPLRNKWNYSNWNHDVCAP